MFSGIRDQQRRQQSHTNTRHFLRSPTLHLNLRLEHVANLKIYSKIPIYIRFQMRTSRDVPTAQESSLKRRRTVFDSDSDQEGVTSDMSTRSASMPPLLAVSNPRTFEAPFQFPAKAEAPSQSASFATHHEYKDETPRDLSITNENIPRNTVSGGLPSVNGNIFDHVHHKDAAMTVHSDLTSRPSVIADPRQTSHPRVAGLDRAPADKPVAAPSRGSLKADLVSLLLDTLQAEVEQVRNQRERYAF